MMYQSIIIIRFVLFLDDVPVQYSEQPTNEVAYIKMMYQSILSRLCFNHR